MNTPPISATLPTPVGHDDPGAKEQVRTALAAHVQQLLASTGDLTDETTFEARTVFDFPGLGTHAYLLPDFALDRTHSIRCVEVNGSNGAGSSVFERDLPRVRHEISVMRARGISLDGDVVMITPESPDTRSTPEIRTRAVLRAALVGEEYDVPVTVARAGHGPVPPGAVSLWGSIPEVADHLTIDADGLSYAGRPVVFLNNANVLVELARRRHLTIQEVFARVSDGVRPDPVHEGALMAQFTLDKVRQQHVLAHTDSIVPVAVTGLSRDLDGLVDTALATAAQFGAAIIKPMAASGGTGVIPVDRTATADAVRAELAAAAAKLHQKYGDGWAESCPLGVFEFIDILPAVVGTDGYRWDLRLQVLVTPERTTITPLSARLCPEPIGLVVDRATSVNNLTGRTTAEANRLSVEELVSLVDAPDDLLASFATAAYELAREALADSAVQR